MRRMYGWKGKNFDWSQITEDQVLDVAQRMAISGSVPDEVWDEFMIVHNAYLDRISK